MLHVADPRLARWGLLYSQVTSLPPLNGRDLTLHIEILHCMHSDLHHQPAAVQQSASNPLSMLRAATSCHKSSDLLRSPVTVSQSFHIPDRMLHVATLQLVHSDLPHFL